VPRVGPAVSRSSLSRSSTGDTWRAIRLLAFSPIATSKRKEQLRHIPDARGTGSVQDPGPQHHRVSSGPSDLRGTRGTQVSHLGVSLIATVDEQGLTPSIRERRKRFGNKHRVIARGHLGRKGVVQRKPKASILVAERVTAISRCHRIRPQSWFSPGLNEGEKGWLKPLLRH
jgi:hypothetical protein